MGLENSIIRGALLNAIRNRPIGVEIEPFLVTASFLGKATYKAALKLLGDYINKIPKRMRKFPTTNPKAEFCTMVPRKKQTIANLKKEQLKELNELVAKVVEKQRAPGAMERWEAQKIDCFLYAQDNNYK